MRATLVAALLLLGLPASAVAAPELVPVGQFDAPVAIAAPPGDASRLFVVERPGVIRLVKHGAVQPAPFADLTGTVRAGGEQGLLGLAFPPDYATSGLLYVFLTAEFPAGELQIRELQRSANPDQAVPGAGRLVLGIAHPGFSNHNGGQLAFGPDGYLYAATGDGGSANDPGDDAAATGSRLGKILRIDPRAAGAQAYSVPADNPFGNEVWSYGLRNPWRFSFDRATGDLLIGDVGQGVKEEIDWAPAPARGRGVNFGWRCWEGSVPTPSNFNDRNSPPLGNPPPAGTLPPAVEHDHDDADGFCAIVGGYVVRDPGLPSLFGRYVYGDFCHSGIESVVLGAPGSRCSTGLTVSGLSSFGEDALGRIHTASLNGAVSRLQEGAGPPPCPPVEAPTSGGGPAGAGAQADRRPPALRIRYRGTQRLRRLRLSLRANEDCVATVRAKRFRTRRLTLDAGVRKLVRLKATRRGARRLRAALARKRRVTVPIRVAARDAAGNMTVRRVRPGVRRR